MAKEVKEEKLVIILELTREDGTGSVEIRARGDYQVEWDGETESDKNRSLSDLTITAQQETAIKSFGANVLEQIKSAEGIN
jgi:hypothetical protein